MPTTKKRIFITLPSGVDKQIARIARRDNVPQASKALQLVIAALEIDEDMMLEKIAESRDTKDAEFVSHDIAWKQHTALRTTKR